jgi:dihydroorotase
MDELTLPRPDDWHLHLRDGDALTAVLPYSAGRFGRAIVMPNLNPPVTTLKAARGYRDRILGSLPPGSGFEPLMTLYLTEETDPHAMHEAREAGVQGVKLYPAGATTHSQAGVSRLEPLAPVLAAMEEAGLPLLVHGEVTDPDVDVFDREAVFIERHLAWLVEKFPALKIVLEHVTTADGVAFVREAREGVAATVTAHHLLINRNYLLAGGIRPHLYCAPIAKAESHRRALLEAATSGNPRFFLGTDSAPHARPDKETACGCAGVFTAHAGIELYAEAFEAMGALENLAGFASRHGPAFYGLPVNRETVTLRREPWQVPERLPYGNSDLVPFRAGETVGWRLLKDS